MHSHEHDLIKAGLRVSTLHREANRLVRTNGEAGLEFYQKLRDALEELDTAAQLYEDAEIIRMSNEEAAREFRQRLIDEALAHKNKHSPN